jgi:hypothetical protein
VTGPAHGDPFALGDEYVYDQQYDQQPDSSNDEWQQLHADLRRDIAYRKHMRDAQVDGDDLHTEYQNEITFMTRQLLALEANFDQLRGAQTAVSRAWIYRNACRNNVKAFGTRCSRWRNVAGGVGAVALILCCTLDVSGFIILLAVFGPLAAAGLHALGVMGGGGRAAEADHADFLWQARSAELQHLREQVLRGVRNPQPLSDNGSQQSASPTQSTAVSLFPK